VHHPIRYDSTWAHVALFTVSLLFAYGLMLMLPLAHPYQHGE